jgi:uncharacterized protein YecA (UPF0149 family)
VVQNAEDRARKLSHAPLRALALEGVSRNTRCPCGSGKKFKHCCIGTLEGTLEVADG